MGSLLKGLTPLLVVAGLLGIGQADDALAAPPANDHLFNATQVFLGGSSGTTTTEATTEVGEPLPSCVGSAAKSVWFKYQVAESLTVTFDTTVTSFDTVMAVYTGPQNAASFATLTPVACNDNSGTSQGSRLSLPVTSGTWYYVQVAGVGIAFGDFFLRLGEFVPNDNLADAIPITTTLLPGQVAEGSTLMATAETGENAPSCGNSTASAWHSWTSPSTPGHVVFDTWGSGFDTVLAVYTGGSHPLTQVACSDEYDYWDAPGPSLTPVFYSGATTFYVQITAYCSGFDCITGGGGGYALNMSLGSTLIVTKSDDTNTSDLGLNLREAMLMTQGTLGRAPDPEEDQLTGIGITAGAGSSDLVHLDMPPCGLFCFGATIAIGSQLPTLAGTGDVISNKGRSARVDGQDLNFSCFNVSGNNNRIEGLGITGCANDPSVAGVFVSGSNNIIGGVAEDAGNNIYGNYAGVLLVGPGTGNRVIGNEIGIDWLGLANANAVGVYLAGSGGNYVGGTAPGEGNVLSGNTYHGIYAFSSTNNTIQGNLIGTNPAGTSAMPNGLTGMWLSSSAGNTIGGGDTAGARNVISGNNGPSVWISELNQVFGPTPIGFGTTNVPITIPNGGAITDLNVNVDITHSTTGNLSISLLSPLGTTVDLSSGNGGSGDNYTRTVFDDEAATAITAGAPPFTGTFRPEVALSAFDGQLPGGVWTLRFQDTAFSFGNSLNSASLHFAATGGVNNTVKGNYIGTDISGTASLPNASHGIKIENSHHNLIGGATAADGNLIANNGGDGVYVGASAASNAIRRNSIHTNTGLGINNDLGGNAGLAPPVILATGSASGTGCANCAIDVYSDAANEGRAYHGSVAADGAGNWSFPGGVVGPNVTAMATDASGNTSEFSAPLACADGDGDVVCNSGDNCPAVANANQADGDGDADGDLCDNCPSWPNAAQNLPTWAVPANDLDCDGFNATIETHVGTDPAKHCPNTVNANDETVDAWPSDFNDSRLTSLADVVLMGPVYNQSTGSDPAKKRFDLNASGVVSLADVVLMGPFYNKGCS